jgi:hypothetical protein
MCGLFIFFQTPSVSGVVESQFERCPFMWQCPVSRPVTHRYWFLFSFNNSLGLLAAYWGVKQPGYEADHSPPSSAEVKNGGAILSLPHTPSWCGA